MLESLSVPFIAGTAVAWAGVVALAAVRRGRMYATFAAILLGVHGLLSVALFTELDGVPSQLAIRNSSGSFLPASLAAV